jgi:hypothetical protein
VTPSKKDRVIHKVLVEHARDAAHHAYENALRHGHRLDCLRAAVADLEGALANVVMEDEEAGSAEVLDALRQAVSKKYAYEDHAQLVRDAVKEGARVEHYGGVPAGDPWFRVEDMLLSPELRARWNAAMTAERAATRYFWRIELQIGNPNWGPSWFLNY